MPYKDPIKRKEASHARYLAKREEILAKNLEWTRKNKERHAEYQRTWAKQWRAANPEKAKEKDSNARKKYRQQRLANMRVFHALESGRLIKPEKCEKCGQSKPLQGHHHRGYSEKHQLDVSWLCEECHQRAHHPVPYVRTRNGRGLDVITTDHPT